MFESDFGVPGENQTIHRVRFFKINLENQDECASLILHNAHYFAKI